MNKITRNFLLIFLLSLTAFSFSYAKDQRLPEVRSSMAMVVNQNTDKVIYQKKAYTQTSIASLTKLMTAMVILDSGIDLNEKVAISKHDIDRLKWTGSRLTIGTKLTRLELLSVALMASDNRAASALSRSYPAGKKAFI